MEGHQASAFATGYAATKVSNVINSIKTEESGSMFTLPEHLHSSLVLVGLCSSIFSFQFTWTKGPGELFAITWRPSSVVHRLQTFHISSFFSETTGLIGTKLSRNVPWMVLFKVSVFRSSRIFNMAARANNML